MLPSAQFCNHWHGLLDCELIYQFSLLSELVNQTWFEPKKKPATPAFLFIKLNAY